VKRPRGGLLHETRTRWFFFFARCLCGWQFRLNHVQPERSAASPSANLNDSFVGWRRSVAPRALDAARIPRATWCSSRARTSLLHGWSSGFSSGIPLALWRSGLRGTACVRRRKRERRLLVRNSQNIFGEATPVRTVSDTSGRALHQTSSQGDNLFQRFRAFRTHRYIAA